eukprot:TRINITY_DN8061_c0_g1_i1.p1 TRINITY_DN8061_c0_g1~~TRINITY_DN8061_c0_g1_i1.p1  ORF type:complete len:357 (+),score=93.00 TRINITY_DN8061_c0_g1_i1:87-1157(+)
MVFGCCSKISKAKGGDGDDDDDDDDDEDDEAEDDDDDDDEDEGADEEDGVEAEAEEDDDDSKSSKDSKESPPGSPSSGGGRFENLKNKAKEYKDKAKALKDKAKERAKKEMAKAKEAKDKVKAKVKDRLKALRDKWKYDGPEDPEEEVKQLWDEAKEIVDTADRNYAGPRYLLYAMESDPHAGAHLITRVMRRMSTKNGMKVLIKKGHPKANGKLKTEPCRLWLSPELDAVVVGCWKKRMMIWLAQGRSSTHQIDRIIVGLPHEELEDYTDNHVLEMHQKLMTVILTCQKGVGFMFKSEELRNETMFALMCFMDMARRRTMTIKEDLSKLTRMKAEGGSGSAGSARSPGNSARKGK